MLDLSQVEQIARASFTQELQELFATLVWQRKFSGFNGEDVIADLANHPDVVEIIACSRSSYDCKLRRQLKTRLRVAIPATKENINATVISGWRNRSNE